MFTITKEIQFDAGHRVPLHESKCKNPHGHRYRIVAHLVGELITEGSEAGMVRDFSHVKKALMERIHDRFDHSFIVAESDEKLARALLDGGDWNINVISNYPTAEVLAKLFYDLVKQDVPELFQIDVGETPTSVATYIDTEALTNAGE